MESVGKVDKTENIENIQAEYKNVEGLKSATSLEMNKIDLKVEENQNKGIENLVKKKDNVSFEDEKKFLSKVKYDTTTTEGKKAQDAVNKMYEILGKKERTEKDVLEYNKQMFILRNIDTKKLSVKDRKTHESVLQETEKINNRIISEYLGINNSRVENDVTSRVMNYFINNISLKNFEKEKSYEKMADELLKTMENMKDYLRNPNKEKDEIKIHEDTTMNNSAIALCTLYYAKAQKDHYIGTSNYEEAKDIYINTRDNLEFTYLNKKGEKVKEKGSEYLEKNNIDDFTYMDKNITTKEYSDLLFTIPQRTDIIGTGEMGMA